MSKPIKGCCKNALSAMINVGELGSSLQILLAASPFVLILPDLLPPGSAQEATEMLGEKLVQMSGEKVLNNIVDTSSLPDFADSVRNVNELSLGLMHRTATLHALIHANGITEGQIWAKLKEIYSEDGEIRSGGGWGLNPFW